MDLQGFKKVPQKIIKFNYNLLPQFDIPSKFKFAFEILNDIFFQHVGLSIIEPKSVEHTIWKIERDTTSASALSQDSRVEEKGRFPKSPLEKWRLPIGKNLSESSRVVKLPRELQKRKSEEVVSTFGKKQKKKNKVLEIETFKQLPFELKALVDASSPKIKFTTQQVADVLDDILDAVEHGRKVIKKQGLRDKRQEQKQLEEIEKYEQEKKMRVLDKSKQLKLQEALQKAKEEKKQKELEKQEKDKQEAKENKLRELEKQKKTEKQHREQRSRVEKFKKDKEELVKQKEIEEKRELSEIKKKAFESQQKYASEKKKEIKEQAEANKQDQAEKQKQIQKEQELKKIIAEKISTKIRKEGSKRREENIGEMDKINKFIDSEPVKQVMAQYEFQTNCLFDFLEGQVYKQVANGKLQESPEIPLNTYSWFCCRFGICPTILSQNQVIFVHRYLTKNKPLQSGLNKKDFLESLIRIAIKAAPTLNQRIEERSRQSNSDISQKNKADVPKSPPRVLDDYSNIDQVTSESLNELFQCIGIPSSKSDINNFFKSKLESTHKSNELENKLSTNNQQSTPKKNKKIKITQNVSKNPLKEGSDFLEKSPEMKQSRQNIRLGSSKQSNQMNESQGENDKIILSRQGSKLDLSGDEDVHKSRQESRERSPEQDQREDLSGKGSKVEQQGQKDE